uniref:Gag-pol protein n=1 Tax=Solanum tuberosum TaxID=4113 RepID=M1DP86_SOLTU
MNTRRTPSRRVEEEVVNEGVPPQGDQGLQGDQVPQENEVPVVPQDKTNEEIRMAFLTLTRAMTTQENIDMGPRVNANESTVASRLRDFVRMNPLIFLVSKVGEDPQEFLDEFYKIVYAMRVSFREKAELASHQLKYVSQVWFTQWKVNRPVVAGPIELDEFKGDFLVDSIDDRIDSSSKIDLCPPSVDTYALNTSSLFCNNCVDQPVYDEITPSDVPSGVNLENIIVIDSYTCYSNPLWCEAFSPRDGNLFLKDESTLVGMEGGEEKGGVCFPITSYSWCVSLLNGMTSAFEPIRSHTHVNTLEEIDLRDTFLYYLLTYDDAHAVEWSMLLGGMSDHLINGGALDPSSWKTIPLDLGIELRCGIHVGMPGQNGRHKVGDIVDSFPYTGKLFLRFCHPLEKPTLCVGKDSFLDPFSISYPKRDLVECASHGGRRYLPREGLDSRTQSYLLAYGDTHTCVGSISDVSSCINRENESLLDSMLGNPFPFDPDVNFMYAKCGSNTVCPLHDSSLVLLLHPMCLNEVGRRVDLVLEGATGNFSEISLGHRITRRIAKHPPRSPSCLVRLASLASQSSSTMETGSKTYPPKRKVSLESSMRTPTEESRMMRILDGSLAEFRGRLFEMNSRLTKVEDEIWAKRDRVHITILCVGVKSSLILKDHELQANPSHSSPPHSISFLLQDPREALSMDTLVGFPNIPKGVSVESKKDLSCGHQGTIAKLSTFAISNEQSVNVSLSLSEPIDSLPCIDNVLVDNMDTLVDSIDDRIDCSSKIDLCRPSVNTYALNASSSFCNNCVDQPVCECSSLVESPCNVIKKPQFGGTNEDVDHLIRSDSLSMSFVADPIAFFAHRDPVLEDASKYDMCLFKGELACFNSSLVVDHSLFKYNIFFEDDEITPSDVPSYVNLENNIVLDSYTCYSNPLWREAFSPKYGNLFLKDESCNDPRAPPSHYRCIRPRRGLIQALNIHRNVYHRIKSWKI